MIRLKIDFPPSVNSMYVNVPRKGRVKSKQYKAWKETALWQIKAQKPPRMECEVSIWIGLVAPSRHAQDASNRIKSVEDAIVAAGIIPDDSAKYVRRISAEWLSSGDPCTVLISPYEG